MGSVNSQRSLRAAGQPNCKLRKTEEGQLDRLGSLELQGKTIHTAGEKMDPHFLLIFMLGRQDRSWVLGFLLPLTPGHWYTSKGVSLVAQLVKNLPAMREIWVRSLGWEDPLEKGKATCSSVLAWRIPWTV